MRTMDVEATPAQSQEYQPQIENGEGERPLRQSAHSNPVAGMGGSADEIGAALRQRANGQANLIGRSLLTLQNQMGNDYVQRLINPAQKITVQPKLMLGDVDTPSERQADQIASQITSGGSATIAPTAVSGSSMPVSPQIESQINQARGSGQPLSDQTRTQMEQSLGTDLSHVRVHTDGRAHSLNQSLQAKAFTTGSDLFFRRGTYNLRSSGGQQLLAHELAHVVQQNNKTPSHSGTDFVQRYIFDRTNNEKIDNIFQAIDLVRQKLNRLGIRKEKVRTTKIYRAVKKYMELPYKMTIEWIAFELAKPILELNLKKMQSKYGKSLAGKRISLFDSDDESEDVSAGKKTVSLLPAPIKQNQEQKVNISKSASQKTNNKPKLPLPKPNKAKPTSSSKTNELEQYLFSRKLPDISDQKLGELKELEGKKIKQLKELFAGNPKNLKDDPNNLLPEIIKKNSKILAEIGIDLGKNNYRVLVEDNIKQQKNERKVDNNDYLQEFGKQFEYDMQTAKSHKEKKTKKNKYWEVFTKWVVTKFSAFGEWLVLTYGKGGGSSVLGVLAVLGAGSWQVIKQIFKLAWWLFKNVGKSLLKPLVIVYNAIWDKKDFFKETKEIWRGRKGHGWNTTFEALGLFAKDVRDWTGWISVITAVLGLIPSLQPLLGVSAIAGSINVLAGFIYAPLRLFHTIIMQTMKYMGKTVDPKIWERSKQESIGAIIGIATTGLTNAVTSLSGGAKSLGKEFNTATDIKTNIENVGKTDDAFRDAIGITKDHFTPIDRTATLNTLGGADKATYEFEITSKYIRSGHSHYSNIGKQSTYAVTDTLFGEIGDKGADVGTAIGVALVPIKLVAKLVSLALKGFQNVASIFKNKKSKIGKSVEEKVDVTKTNGKLMTTISKTKKNLDNSVKDLKAIKDEVANASKKAKKSRRKLRPQFEEKIDQ